MFYCCLFIQRLTAMSVERKGKNVLAIQSAGHRLPWDKRVWEQMMLKVNSVETFL